MLAVESALGWGVQQALHGRSLSPRSRVLRWVCLGHWGYQSWALTPTQGATEGFSEEDVVGQAWRWRAGAGGRRRGDVGPQAQAQAQGSILGAGDSVCLVWQGPHRVRPSPTPNRPLTTMAGGCAQGRAWPLL